MLMMDDGWWWKYDYDNYDSYDYDNYDIYDDDYEGMITHRIHVIMVYYYMFPYIWLILMVFM